MKATMTNTETAEGMTPRTDEEARRAQECGHVYGVTEAAFARGLERELAQARAKVERLTKAGVPICIGRPIIGILAKEGQWVSQDGQAVIAADELFRNDPYDQLSTANAARRDAEAKVEEAIVRLREIAGPLDADCDPQVMAREAVKILSTTIPGKSRVAELERAARDIDKAIGLLFWTSDDGESIRDGQPEDTDAPEDFQKAWKQLRAALTPPKAASAPSAPVWQEFGDNTQKLEAALEAKGESECRGGSVRFRDDR